LIILLFSKFLRSRSFTSWAFLSSLELGITINTLQWPSWCIDDGLFRLIKIKRSIRCGSFRDIQFMYLSGSKWILAYIVRKSWYSAALTFGFWIIISSNTFLVHSVGLSLVILLLHYHINNECTNRKQNEANYHCNQNNWYYIIYSILITSCLWDSSLL